MATTVGNIQTRIQSHGYATDTSAAQIDLIASVYRRVNGMRRWPFLEVFNNTSITCTIGDPDYDLDTITDFLHLEAIRIEKSQDFYELEYLRPQQFRRYAHAYRDNAIPRYYTKIGNFVHLAPRPDKTYTLNVDYVKEPPVLDSADDNIVWPDTYADILTWGAITELCFRERDADGAVMAKEHYNELLGAMMVEFDVRQRQQPDRVQQSGIYDQYDPEYSYLWPTS